MQIEIRQFEPRTAVCMSHRGPYPLIRQTFERFFIWLKETGAEAGPFVAIYYDDPGKTPAEDLRSDAGVLVPDGFVTADARVHVVDMPAGTYAVGTHVGSHDGIPAAWRKMAQWLPSCGYQWAQGLPFELYVDERTTEIWIPVAPSGG